MIKDVEHALRVHRRSTDSLALGVLLTPTPVGQGILDIMTQLVRGIRPADSGQTEKTAVPPAPPTPVWVNPDGTVDESKMPEELPLIGADGKVVEDANGKTSWSGRASRSRSPVRPRRPWLVPGPGRSGPSARTQKAARRRPSRSSRPFRPRSDLTGTPEKKGPV
ncbi:hypothetical protein [Streptomyces sp. NPDC056672]|uniref:hypothetical protein n=1 Tax=Streptomyces sp. NPDC056672 TaxID=3345906 RepID=UPI00367CCB78